DTATRAPPAPRDPPASARTPRAGPYPAPRRPRRTAPHTPRSATPPPLLQRRGPGRGARPASFQHLRKPEPHRQPDQQQREQRAHHPRDRRLPRRRLGRPPRGKQLPQLVDVLLRPVAAEPVPV